MTKEKQNEIFAKLEDMSGEEVARAFTDYHGMQLINDEFEEFLIDEGYI